MNAVKCFNEFDNLNDYLMHEQYKFVFQHPSFIKYGNKNGLVFIKEKEINNTLKYHFMILAILLSALGSQVLGVNIPTWVDYILVSFFSLTLFHGSLNFIFYRQKLINKLEKRFLTQKVNSQHIKRMLPILNIEQKERILDILANKESITFEELIRLLEKIHNKIEKEKIILLLNK